MNLPKFRLPRKDTVPAPVAEPDPADMGTCFGLDLALTAPLPTADANTGAKPAPAQRHQRTLWRSAGPRRG